jgi:catechol 2,3-dioxygenase-like lactoylglutathione lyase family enzyme
MSERCHHIGLFAAQPDRLIDFYINKLGFILEAEKEVPQYLMRRVFDVNSSCRLIKLRRGDAVLEIFSCSHLNRKRLGDRNLGFNHWGLGVDDKEAFCLEVERKGVTLLKIDMNGRFIIFIKDPEGNLIELCQIE